MRIKYCYQTCFFMVLIMMFFCVTTALAGTLNIKTQTTLQTSGNQLKAAVTLTNEGTEIAYNLQARLELFGETLDSQVEPQLDPAGSSTFSFEKSTEGIKTGRYPLTVYVDFHDANRYPFSALSGMTLSVGNDVNPDLAVIGKDISIGEKGTLSLNIKNIDNVEKNITATLALPRELSTPAPQINFLLPSRSHQDLTFDIHNFTALPGGGYPVFCYFEYDLNDIHYTTVCTAVIKTVEQENLFRRYRVIWAGLAGMLIIVLLMLIIKKRINAEQ